MTVEVKGLAAASAGTKIDPYFNEINSARVLRAYSDMRAGRNSAEHDLIELNDEEDMT
jgi:hypothetical protein